MPQNLTIEEEQAAFDAAVESLMKEHAGKFVLFRNGHPVEFFDDHAAAYERGLELFGLDSTFLVGEVTKTEPQPVSLAWDAGVMFG